MLKVGSEIFQIFQKFSCNTNFLQELISITYLEFIKFLFDKFSELFLHFLRVLSKCTVTLLL